MRIMDAIKSAVSIHLGWMRLRRQKTPPRITDERYVVVPIGQLSASCDVCTASRPDRRLGLYIRQWTDPLGVTSRENIRYCNDNKDCVAVAHMTTLTNWFEEPKSEWSEVGA